MRSKERLLRIIPFTVARESISFPIFEPSLEMLGILILRLWLAICPTTLAT